MALALVYGGAGQFGRVIVDALKAKGLTSLPSPFPWPFPVPFLGFSYQLSN